MSIPTPRAADTEIAVVKKNKFVTFLFAIVLLLRVATGANETAKFAPR